MMQARRGALWLVAVGAGALVLPALLGSWKEREAALESGRTRLAALSARRLAPAEAERLKRALASAPDLSTGLLVVAREPDAEPRLEAVLKAAIQNHGGEVLSVGAARPATAGGPNAAHATAHFTIAAENLGALVRSLEVGPPAAFFDQLRIARRTPEEEGPAAMLDVVASVAVYYEVFPRERVP